MATRSIKKHRDRQQNSDSTPDLEPQVAEVLNDLPSQKRETILRALSIRQHLGPLPDGDTIKIYGEVIPDGGNRLMANVEKQLAHRIDIEKKGINRTYNQSSTGQWMAFAIAIFFGLIAWDLGRNGQVVIASILGSVDLVALVAVFITGRLAK